MSRPVVAVFAPISAPTSNRNSSGTSRLSSCVLPPVKSAGTSGVKRLLDVDRRQRPGREDVQRHRAQLGLRTRHPRTVEAAYCRSGGRGLARTGTDHRRQSHRRCAAPPSSSTRRPTSRSHPGSSGRAPPRTPYAGAAEPPRSPCSSPPARPPSRRRPRAARGLSSTRSFRLPRRRRSTPEAGCDVS